MFKFKPLKKKDLHLLFKWFSYPHVAKWWKEPEDWERFEEKYTPKNRISNYVFPFLIFINGTPIGYIQYYLVDKADNGWWVKKGGQPEGAVGMDLLIGEVAYLGKGHGTLIVKDFVKKILKEKEPIKIIIDPDPQNIAAIKCYEKAGFKKIKEITTIHGHALLMELIVES